LKKSSSEGILSLPRLRPIHHLRFNAKKTYAALCLMLAWAKQDVSDPVDLHEILRACYFADKHHLNLHWRPVFGATYRAMPWGPVPLEIHEMAKGEPIWLAELGRSDYPWRLEGSRIVPTADEAVDARCLSPSDLKALQHGFMLARTLTFAARTPDTHDRAWERARHGLIDYTDMVDEDNPNREDIIDLLQEDGHFWRL
jgi:hypothetical protein